MTRDWMIDEHRHAGEEHLDPDQVARYDEKLPFDPIPELEHLVDQGLTEDDTVVDFGTGTGVFPLAAAEYCDRVVAIDISEPCWVWPGRKSRMRASKTSNSSTTGS